MGTFYTDLQVREVKRGGLFSKAIYELTSPLIYESDNIGFIIVNKSEQTDFDSTPRVPIFYMLLGDRGKAAAVLHDHLYTVKCDITGRPITRSMADRVLRGATYECLRIDIPVSARDSLINVASLIVVWLIWAGVRIGGSSHW